MKLNKVLKEAFNARESDLRDEKKLISLDEWDSMNHMLFITRLEETYEVILDGDEIASMETIGDIKKVLQTKGIEL